MLDMPRKFVRQLPSATTAVNTDIEQLIANKNTAVENVRKTSIQQKTAKPTMASQNAATAVENMKTGTTNAQHELLSPVGLTACGGNFHLISPLKRTLGSGP
jgi:hypothetical protein